LHVTDNPYWDAVAPHVTPGLLGGPEVKAYPWPIDNAKPRRDALASQYAWTITDPDTVAFVAKHAGESVLDPMAGTGYWSYLLGQLGADVVASDIAPPDTAANHYHKAGITHVRVAQRDAVRAVTYRCAAWTLLLAWPPYDSPLGTDIIRAYQGDRIVYIGEGEGGCCGDDAMFDLLADGWVQVAEHRPVQFGGIHDYVAVYERKH
jgi:hypothetical protein